MAYTLDNVEACRRNSQKLKANREDFLQFGCSISTRTKIEFRWTNDNCKMGIYRLKTTTLVRLIFTKYRMWNLMVSWYNKTFSLSLSLRYFFTRGKCLRYFIRNISWKVPNWQCRIHWGVFSRVLFIQEIKQ